MPSLTFPSRCLQLLLTSLCVVILTTSCTKKSSETEAEVLRVSILELISHPERFDKRRVKTVGFYHESYPSAIYPYEEDFKSRRIFRVVDFFDYDSEYSLKHCSGNYIEIAGYITAVETATPGRFAVYFTKITEIKKVIRSDTGSITRSSCG